MRKYLNDSIFWVLFLCFCCFIPSDAVSATDNQTEGVLYTVSCSHLDTQWFWTVRETINEHLPATFNQNFSLFERFPDYSLSFEGAFRYQLIKEYYPKAYERIRAYIAQGRWHVAGSSYDAGDVNIVSSESLIRHFLYGNNYFEDEFGKRSVDVFLPDCFGFGWQLPTLASHCGIKGFSTQKLGWGSAIPLPFEIGLWQGPDGSRLIAAINPGSYTTRITSDLSADAEWIGKARQQAEQTGLRAAFKYIGVGDAGGGLDPESATWLEKSIREPSGPLKVVNTASDQLFRDLAEEQIAGLKVYDGPLLLRTHGVGCYTSQAAMKRLNRKNELLADAAERAAAASDWMGGYVYPRDTLTEAWERFLWHQFHDDLTGTSIPEVYEISWNDEFVSLNQFGGVLEAAVENAARGLDTTCEGQAVVVYNPLSFGREDVVEAEVTLSAQANGVQVFDPEGQEVPCQVLSRKGEKFHILFLARVPAVGFKVFEVRARRPGSISSELSVTANSLENASYRVNINSEGDIASIYDKRLGRELLAEPIRLALLHDHPRDWPAWEITWEDTAAKPKAYVGGPVQMRVVEEGPVRAGIEIVRRAQDSVFKQTVRLSAGEAGSLVECENLIDWHTDVTLLKAAFPFTAGHDRAVYDMGIGGIEYKTSHSGLYEVPGQQWADLTDAGGEFGAAVLNDCKYGWDKPDEHTLRLTLLHSPGPHRNFPLQTQLDFGFHKVTYGVYGHAGNWQRADLSRRSARLNQPMTAFAVEKDKGRLGKVFSFVSAEKEGVLIKAVKKAERTDELIVRVHEVNGEAADDVEIRFAKALARAREVDGTERPVGEAVFEGETLKTSLRPYQIRTFAVGLKDSGLVMQPACVKAVKLPFNADMVSTEQDMTNGGIDTEGRSIPAELWPEKVTYKGIGFALGGSEDGQNNAVVCRGQRITLPAGYTKLYLLACATEDTQGVFHLNGTAHTLRVQGHDGFFGQWETVDADCTLRDGYNYRPGYLKKDDIAWVGTHRHTQEGRNEAYTFCYLYAYELDLPEGDGAAELRLADNDKIRIAAMTAVHPQQGAELLTEIVSQDDIINPIRIKPSSALFVDTIRVQISDPRPGVVLRYRLDGSEPDEQSPVYQGPLTLDKTTMLRVRGYADGVPDAFSRGGKYVRQAPAKALAAGAFAPGLRYDCYTGDWHSMPEFSSMEAVTSGVLDRVRVDVEPPDGEYYGLVIKGFIRVDRTGVHYFRLACDDGGVLYVAGGKVVNNDGRHGMNIVRDGFAVLEKGVHPFTLEYFNGGGGGGVEITYRGPDGAEMPMDAILINEK